MITQYLEQIHIIQFCIYSMEIYQAAWITLHVLWGFIFFLIFNYLAEG